MKFEMYLLKVEPNCIELTPLAEEACPANPARMTLSSWHSDGLD